ncbi:MAG: LPS export ABC transporter ATP-binding protein [Gammaproteobacteria bacterium]|nr:LPS export ABC transporter ATP-binding protein [Gammaproteobacteria bacterium]NND40382.1 LPS export ABC transporter ATP-binding protein [Pseudomonadales bacterium]MBT8149837.1 LPS export ABC transporter ATP-binding protein [Gammaproteobacteria bacterium]NNL10404.1 LPS export ABC transporter ATP-binding protein [Pseudomonadales bacterium]NNM12555.1 LPS export ABC transporter ATP-binding protein [Pseudomonadales bacterium]
MSKLVANKLAKSYSKRQVITDVSLQVESGQVIGLLGPNGAGKTTCFYMIAGIVPADAGEITLSNENGEHNLTHLPMHKRARLGLGYLPQEASVFRKLSVFDNILAILETRPGLKRKARLARAQELLEEFRLEHIRDSQGMALSGGERRRVEIARALASDPDFILLDEPFAGVDPISVNDIKSIVYQLRDRGLGVLITDHNVRDTLDLCERAYIVGEGEVIAEGDTQSILANQRVRDIYLGHEFNI